MKAILLAGYRDQTDVNDAPGLQTEPTGGVRLDRRIEQLRARGLEVLCVVSGEAAEAQIRRAPRLGDTELIYDTNAPAVSLATNLRAGLVAAGEKSCLCLPVEIPLPPATVFERLVKASRGDLSQFDLAQVGASDSVEAFGFPLLITPRGTGRLRQLPELNTLADPRLRYLYLNL